MDERMISFKDVARKRKIQDVTSGSDVDDDDLKVAKLDCRDQTKKQNHSEIEKRRRDKMNKYITELSSMVPMCNAMSRKLDKLTVLRMAVQHMKTLRGSINSYVEGHCKPSFLSDEELKHLILQAAEGFLFVVSCDRGRILFVSESVSHILNYSQGDLLGQSWFDILHPKDIAKVKEQLSSSDLSPKERLIDAKTMLPVKGDIPQSQIRLCPGARRSFFCRMKYKVVSSVKEELEINSSLHKKRKSQSSDRRYCVIHCTGYLKSWASANLNIEAENEIDNDCNLSCLVAIGQVQQEPCGLVPPRAGIELRPIEFTSRHSMDCKFLFVDQRVTLILGYLPQELLGTSCYEYFHQNDIMHLADCHRQVLQTNEQILTHIYRFRTKEGTFVYLQSKWKTFHNPWTKEFEYIVAVNTLVQNIEYRPTDNSATMTEEVNSNSSSLDTVLSYLPATENVGDVQRAFGTRVGAGKIGRQIADEAMELQKVRNSSTSGNPVIAAENFCVTGPAVSVQCHKEDRANISVSNHNFAVPSDASTNILENGEFSGNSQPNNASQYQCNMQVNSNVNNPELGTVDSLMGREMLLQNSNSEGNDEAAMAVIMSLLEADAGLGGPVDFSGLPWPLP